MVVMGIVEYFSRKMLKKPAGLKQSFFFRFPVTYDLTENTR